MNTQAESLRLPADRIRDIEMRMRQARIPLDLVFDSRKGDTLWDNIQVLFMPLGAKHIFNNAVLSFTTEAVGQMRRLQNEWNLGEDSFPAILFVPLGTKNFKVEWAMVRSEHFARTPEQLLESIQWANETLQDDDCEHYIRSMEFVHAATTGAWPSGVDKPAPLAKLPLAANF